MILVTTDYISGKELEMLGVVSGSIIPSKNIGKDIKQGFRILFGGELKGYSEMMDNGRETATKRMIENAQEIGADAIIGVRYTSSVIMQLSTEITVYGTAVKFRV